MKKKIKSSQDKLAEREFFDKEAAGIYGTYGDVDSLSKEAIVVLKLDELHGAVVGELGCGTGKFGRYLTKNGNQVTGVDLSPEMLKLNRSWGTGVVGYTCLEGDLEDKELFGKESCDVLLYPFVLHHIPDVSVAFSNMALWLKKDGFIYMIEPNGSNPVNVLSKFVFSFLTSMLPKLSNAEGFQSANEVKDHSIKSYINMLERHGFSIDLVRTIHKPVYIYRGFVPVSFLGFIKYFLYLVNYFTNPVEYMKGLTVVIKARKNT